MRKILLLLCLWAAVCAGAALAQTAWPASMPSLEPGLSESSVAAVLPPDVAVVPPGPDVPPDKARWSGLWQGWACRARLCEVKLAVETVTATGATLVYVGAAAGQPVTTERLQARFADGELRAQLRASKLVLRMRASGDVELSLWRANGELGVAGVLSQRVPAFARSIERVPTPWLQDGRPQTLELVVYRPPGPGPFPTLVFNHGSTGDGNRPEWFTATWSAPEVAGYFAAKGWQVLLPQRRGRGNSDGLYDEGFEADRSRYACRAELSLPGLERAMADLDAVMAHLAARKDVKADQVLIGGVSRGGILSVAYAGTRGYPFAGVLNFVGGWVGDRCPDADDINPLSFKRGAAFARPMLWLYGERDPFYSLRHSRKNYEAFLSAGGRGSFVAFDPPPAQNGHAIHSNPALWKPAVESYLTQLGLP